LQAHVRQRHDYGSWTSTWILDAPTTPARRCVTTAATVATVTQPENVGPPMLTPASYEPVACVFTDRNVSPAPTPHAVGERHDRTRTGMLAVPVPWRVNTVPYMTNVGGQLSIYTMWSRAR